jgi:glycosyltransferase involved in cell wall biosynthesis
MSNTSRQNAFELIVGIPSYNEADTIGYVAHQVDRGLQKYFASLRTIIVNVDNNSQDNTKEAFLSTKTKTPKEYITTPKNVRGKGTNLFNLFKFARLQGDALKGVVVVDADLKSITPEWIRYLGEPILKGFDYTLPYYSRHQFDGTITNHICYPLIYGLLNQNIRQPIGGEFALSTRLIYYLLEQEWEETTRQYGIDIFMTLQAIFGHFKLCEAGLGAKVHKASAPKLGPMFTQVVRTLFDQLLIREPEWLPMPAKCPQVLKRFGLKKLCPPQELKIDIRDLKEKLRSEYYPRRELLKKYLHDYTVSMIEGMFEEDNYYVDILLWTQIVYQLLYYYHNATPEERKEIIEALKPLYFARSVTFNYQTWRYNVNYAEEAILEQAKAFASQKPYLMGLHLNGVMEKILH